MGSSSRGRVPEWARLGRGHWKHTGTGRPPFALEPGPGQESVWDYPRPPRVEPDDRRVVVRVGERVLADSRSGLRVLETASPPTFYLPPQDVDRGLLQPGRGQSRCEWKGVARYWNVVAPEVPGGEGVLVQEVGWSYPDPFPEFEALRDHLAFYPGRVACFVGGQRVRPQPGGFYGGWITAELVGPFKGEPGTGGW